MLIILLMTLFLCWGSFLNVLAHRFVMNIPLTVPRSTCPQCKHTIAWYDNIPVLSWLLLKGKCRICTNPISVLYPSIEVLTAWLLCSLYLWTPTQYFFAYFIFFSALIVTIRTDIEMLLISRFTTLFLIPVAFLLSLYHWLPITPIESIASASFGYLFLFLIGRIFTYFTGKSGIGQGDFDLLAFIGAFTGAIGCWISLLIGSILGSISGLTYIIFFKPKNNILIPFGPFLAIGAILFVLFNPYIYKYLVFSKNI